MKKPTVEQRRTEILEAACQVVIERGFAGTRISDVAKRLDVSSSLIHYHFDSKEQLLAEAFAFYARTDVAEMEAEIDAAPNALGKLDRLIHNYVPEGSDDVEWMLWIDAWGEALRNPLMRSISKELDALSAALGLDMADWWEPTAEAYLNHVPKAQIIAALKEAGPELAGGGVEAMKKDALVSAAASRLAGTRWLPEPLRRSPG
ncbi:MAG TPA: helix-turn-helix domain-containing protein [Ilumatobacteraceae bacterium]|nr:helix-turn-helix domain-containing protein [Ilumatobacteraceae bacterium]